MSGRPTEIAKLLSFYCVITVCHSLCAAQSDTSAARSDTSAIHVVGESAKPAAGGFHPRKSAWLAVGLSAVAPGVGQIYDESYWKPPIVWGLGAYWISQWIDLNKSYKHYGTLYSASITPAQPEGDGQNLGLRDFYRDQRDKFAWYLGALYFLNLIDAYVGANLYDFDVGPDLSLDGKVAPKATATIRWRF